MPRKQPQPNSNPPVVAPEVTPQEPVQEASKAVESAPLAEVKDSEPSAPVASNQASPKKPLKVEKLPGGVTIETF